MKFVKVAPPPCPCPCVGVLSTPKVSTRTTGDSFEMHENVVHLDSLKSNGSEDMY